MITKILKKIIYSIKNAIMFESAVSIKVKCRTSSQYLYAFYIYMHSNFKYIFIDLLELNHRRPKGTHGKFLTIYFILYALFFLCI